VKTVHFRIQMQFHRADSGICFDGIGHKAKSCRSIFPVAPGFRHEARSPQSQPNQPITNIINV